MRGASGAHEDRPRNVRRRGRASRGQRDGLRAAPSQALAAPGHPEAAARIRWIIDEAAIGVITGEVGVGARGLHQHLAWTLGVAPRFHRGALIAQTAQLLTRERDQRDKQVVLIVDDAHLLDADQLEQVRLLTKGTRGRYSGTPDRDVVGQRDAAR